MPNLPKQAAKSNGLRYEVIPSQDVSGEWRAEAIDMESDGIGYVVIFCGPDAEDRAREYAEWKNSRSNTLLSAAR